MAFRKLTLILVAICFLTLGLSSTSQAGIIGLNAFAGLNFPSGDYDTVKGKTGYILGAGYSKSLIPLVSIGAMGAYTQFGWKNDVDGNFNAWELMATGRAHFLGFFGQLGLGLANWKATVRDLPADRNTDFAWALGAGGSIAVIEIALMYHNINTSGDAANFWTLTAGLNF